MTEVIEFSPFLKRKQASECAHTTYVVGMKEASLTCHDCDAELDPWWVLRSLVLRYEEEEAARTAQRRRAMAAFQEWEAKCKQAMRFHERWVADANARIEKMTAEINRLRAEKLRLANDPEIARARAARRSKGVKP